MKQRPPIKKSNIRKGFFKPRNPQKYKGNPVNIVYRSAMELKCMLYFDSHPDVLEWSSEETIVPYVSPKDNRVHRYFPDFIIKARKADGKISKVMIEVKPDKQTKPPKARKKNTPKYLEEQLTFAINTAKWKAAREYCAKRGMEFEIFTEHDIGFALKTKGLKTRI